MDSDLRASIFPMDSHLQVLRTERPVNAVMHMCLATIISHPDPIVVSLHALSMHTMIVVHVFSCSSTTHTSTQFNTNANMHTNANQCNLRKSVSAATNVDAINSFF